MCAAGCKKRGRRGSAVCLGKESDEKISANDDGEGCFIHREEIRVCEEQNRVRDMLLVYKRLAVEDGYHQA